MSDHTPAGRWAFVTGHSLLLVAGTVTALAWANIHLASYQRVTHPLHFLVNDIGMAFFFALAAKEIIEATLPGGALGSARQAAVPLLSALGGILVPASLYALLARLLDRPELLAGWAIPCATDIAFSYMAARLIFAKTHPAIPFLLLLAVADDALGLALLAVFYPSGPQSPLLFALFMVPALAVSAWLGRRRVQSFWPYIVGGGSLSWAAFYLGGVHPALALIPVLPFLPHAARDRGQDGKTDASGPDTLHRFELWWRTPVQFVLLLFGLVNAGVPLSGLGEGSWMVLSALLIGKPIGIVGMASLGVLLGLRLPAGLRLADLLILSVTAAVGFTVALFFATAAFPPGQLLDEAKMGALLSFVAAPVAISLARLRRAAARRLPS